MSAGRIILGVGLLGGAYVLYANRANAQTAQMEPVIMPAVQRSEPSGLDKLQQYAPLLEWGVDQLNLFGSDDKNTNTGGGLQTTLAGLFDRFTGGGGSDPAPSGNVNTIAPDGGITQASYGPDIGVAGIDFADYERRYGLPRGYLRRTAEIESAMNPRAQNPRSSAGGLFQFIDATAREFGLTDRFDPVASTEAAARLAQRNKRQLRPVLGRDPSGAELYLAHQQGGGGAARLLRNRNARAADVVGSAAVRLNGGGPNMSAGQFADLWINKFNRVA